MKPPILHQQHARIQGATTPNVPSRQTKALSSTDGGNYQAAIPRRLPGRQPLFNVAVYGTALGTRPHAQGIPGLQSSYPSVKSVEAKGIRHARGIWPALDNTEDFFIFFGTASVRPRCGHTSARSGHEQRYHPLKWSSNVSIAGQTPPCVAPN